MRLEAKRAERNESIANAKKHREPLSHDQLESDQISDDDLSDKLAAKVAKKWSMGPANWIDIVEEANKFRSSEAIKNYRLEFFGLGLKQSQQKSIVSRTIGNCKKESNTM